MDKQEFIETWGKGYSPSFEADLNVVIAYEIEKAKGEDKPAPNPIRLAYERGEKIKHKEWNKHSWIKKHSETKAIDEKGLVWNYKWDFDTKPEEWEIFPEAEAEAEQVTEQPAPPMTYKEAVNLIILNRLTHKWAGNDSWFACGYCGKTIQFCDENGQDMIEVKFDELDLTEWYPHTKPFDQDRFEAMFRAVVASGRTESYDQDFLATNICLEKLDAFYASKKGGENE